jgi:hypothetical protein
MMNDFLTTLLIIVGSYVFGMAFFAMFYIFMVRVFPRQFCSLVATSGLQTIQECRDDAMKGFSITMLFWPLALVILIYVWGWTFLKNIGNRLLNIADCTTKPLMRMARKLAGANPDA